MVTNYDLERMIQKREDEINKSRIDEKIQLVCEELGWIDLDTNLEYSLSSRHCEFEDGLLQLTLFEHRTWSFRDHVWVSQYNPVAKYEGEIVYEKEYEKIKKFISGEWENILERNYKKILNKIKAEKEEILNKSEQRQREYLLGKMKQLGIKED